jgi:antitoxin component of MazEF toxin-antitoxin module
MRAHKKLFKHGGSLAVVMPAEFTKRLKSQNVTLEVSFDGDTPIVTVKPVNSLDTIEADPIFELFIEALYRDAMENPEKLLRTKDIWDERALKLLEGVDTSDEE